MSKQMPVRRRFADFTFDVSTGELARDGARLELQNRSIQVLQALTDRPGRLVSREELRSALWPGDVVVEFDNNLNAAVNRLRRVLGDSVERPRFIETLPGRGYRFIMTVASEEATAGEQPEIPSAGWRERLAPRALAAVVAVLLCAGVLSYRTQPLQVAVLGFENVSGDPAQDHVGVAIGKEIRARFGQRHTSIQVLVPADDAGPAGDVFARARLLRADYVVVGSVDNAPDGLRVTALLVDVRSQRRVWGDAFMCPRRDLPAVQAQVASKISRLMSDRLGASAP